jgi:hypothetical protein
VHACPVFNSLVVTGKLQPPLQTQRARCTEHVVSHGLQAEGRVVLRVRVRWRTAQRGLGFGRIVAACSGDDLPQCGGQASRD